MIYDDMFDGHRIILSDAVEPRSEVRILGGGFNFPAARTYMQNGHTVRFGTPVPLLKNDGYIRRMKKFDGTALQEVAKEVSALDEMQGGWYAPTNQDLLCMCMQFYFECRRWICKSAREFSIETSERDMITQIYCRQLELSGYLRPLVQSEPAAALLVAALGDPRWFMCRDAGEDTQLLEALFFGRQHNVTDKVSFSYYFLRSAFLGSELGNETYVAPAVFDSPLGRVYRQSLSSGASKEEAVETMLVFSLRFLWRVWWDLILGVEFDACAFFGSDEDADFFYSHI